MANTAATEDPIYTDVSDVDESSKKYVEEYKQEHFKACKRHDYRSGDKISLEGILEIVEIAPSLKVLSTVAYASRCGTANYDSLREGRYI